MLLGDRCQKIERLALDVDGVLTDGSIIYNDAGANSRPSTCVTARE